jgi:RNA polymerase sigma-70 factor (sigma-E family)
MPPLGVRQPFQAVACFSRRMTQINIAMPASKRDALREAFEQHYVPLLRLCIALSGRRDVGEDIVQEAFVRAADRISDLPTPQILPYLRRVALNVWRNRLRRLALESRLRPLRREPAHDASALLDERAVVMEALSHLPARQKACVILRYLEDLSEPETATILRCSIGTVKSQTSRALQKLRRELEDEY